MALIKGLSGLDQVLKNLNAQVNAMTQRGTDGLIKGGIVIRRQAQVETPVETSNLVQSCYGPEIHQETRGPVAQIGFTAAYAPFVHEMVGANFTGPRPSATSPARQAGGKPTAKAKFLEDPWKQNEKTVLQIIADSVRIK